MAFGVINGEPGVKVFCSTAVQNCFFVILFKPGFKYTFSTQNIEEFDMGWYDDVRLHNHQTRV